MPAISIRRLLLTGALVLAPVSASAQLDMAAFEALRQRTPDDPVVLYSLAALHAAAGNTAAVLDLLDAVSGTWGGLDPSFHRGFWSLHDTSRFAQIVDRIRRANPPIVRSVPAVTVAERDLHPEGIAFDSVTRAIFLGSFKGKIIRIDSLGAVRDFADATTPGETRVVVGIRVDPVRRHLWATVDDPAAFGDSSRVGAALHRYDLASGRLEARFDGVKGGFNDVVVAPNGDAYTTNTTDGSIWVVRAGSSDLSRFLPPGSVLDANGITISPDGKHLYIAGWHDIFEVTVATGELRPLPAPPGVVTGSFDGLYWYRGDLVGIQNGIHPGRVVRLHLDPLGSRIVEAQILERYHPRFAGMTTAALDGSALLYPVNTQSRKFNSDGTVKSGEMLDEILIVRLALD